MQSGRRLSVRVGCGLLLTLAAVVAPGCGDDGPPPGYYCRENRDCPPGYDCCTRSECYGTCLVHCDEDRDCYSNRCEHHMCYPP